jgi:hypothetical protein
MAEKRKAEGDAPLMKRQAKAAPPLAAQSKQAGVAQTKAPITKGPPNGKAPIAKLPPKAPIAKRLPIVAAGAPPLAAGADFAKRPPPPIPTKAPSAEGFSKASGMTPPASPTSSDVASAQASPNGTSGPSWQRFSDTDPLYALIGELGEKKVVTSGGDLDEERLQEYIERLVQPGVAKPKDWIEVWAAMNIPVEINVHATVVQHIIEIGVSSETGDTISEVLAELVKGHRAKVKAVEQAIATIFECGCDEKDCISKFLLLIFPKSPTSEWGWSRVGWSWKEWWGIAEKILASMESSGAFEALRSLLSAIETESGTYLPHQQIWDEKRLSLVRAALCRYGGLQEDELVAAVDISLS